MFYDSENTFNNLSYNKQFNIYIKENLRCFEMKI